MCVMLTAVSSIASSSCSAVTVTVCAVSQLPDVNVSVVLSRVRSVPVTPPRVTVTSPTGSVSRTTV